MTYSADGDPDMELDCSAVMADVWLLLDGECDPGAKARLQAHLESCTACLSHYGIEQQIKALVGRKCGGERAPEGLRERLSIQIRTTRIEYRSQ